MFIETPGTVTSLQHFVHYLQDFISKFNSIGDIFLTGSFNINS